MNQEHIYINNIPSTLWGNKSNKVFIAIHGNLSNKEDIPIQILADVVTQFGYQVLSFDLPEHGERINNHDYLCNVQNCVNDLKVIMEYAKNNYDEISIWACSMGAYFSLLAYQNENINQCLFLSPIVDMKILIENMMLWANTNIKELEEKKEIKTHFGQTLYWDYYQYVINHPITKWNIKTNILYGSQDNMQSEEIMKNFSNSFNCNLSILTNGEHYFHTDEQLEYYKEWLNKLIKY
jgi:esterase/lipase